LQTVKESPLTHSKKYLALIYGVIFIYISAGVVALRELDKRYNVYERFPNICAFWYVAEVVIGHWYLRACSREG
jgi:ubiquitin-protein ligase/Ran GTPase-activating protein (RanGAP) involved in mRNA processing and transport